MKTQNVPLKNEPSPDIQDWFQGVFSEHCLRFATPMIAVSCNTYSFDILAFEKFLHNRFGYPMCEDGSMKNFMVGKFGKENTSRFEDHFIKSKQKTNKQIGRK